MTRSRVVHRRLAGLAEAKAVLEARAQARYEAEKAEHEAKQRKREEKCRKTGHKPRGENPNHLNPGRRQRPVQFQRPKVANNEESTNKGFDQHYNVQVVVDQESLLIVALGCPTIPMISRRPHLPSKPSIQG